MNHDRQKSELIFVPIYSITFLPCTSSASGVISEVGRRTVAPGANMRCRKFVQRPLLRVNKDAVRQRVRTRWH
jgi:hypothetical protein